MSASGSPEGLANAQIAEPWLPEFLVPLVWAGGDETAALGSHTLISNEEKERTLKVE